MFKREFRLETAELRGAMLATGDMVISGYVNKTGEQSVALPTGFGNEFYETIEKGAFQRAIDKALDSGRHIDFLAEHDHEKILSSTKNSTLMLRENQDGLYMSAIIADTSWGRDFYSLVKSGIINSFSFGFKAVDDSWEESGDGTLYRTVHDLDLFEVSLVRHPAYKQSFAEARGLKTLEETLEEGHRRLEMEKDKDKKVEEVEEKTKKVEETEEVTDEERQEKTDDLEVREDETEGEEDSVLDVTESILAIDAKLETITAKLDEVLGIFLDSREEEIEEPVEEEEEEETEESEEKSMEDRNKEIVEEALKELASILQHESEEER